MECVGVFTAVGCGAACAASGCWLETPGKGAATPTGWLVMGEVWGLTFAIAWLVGPVPC